MKKILIFGSCVSRDIINFQNEGEAIVELSAYFARSSIASAFAEVKVEDVYTGKLSSAFQRRVVRDDLSNNFKNSIRKIEFDCLLVDFIDERFNLFQFTDGALCTLSSELLRTDFMSLNQGAGKVIKTGSSEYFELWEKGWTRFVRLLRELGCLDKVIINKVYWASPSGVNKRKATSYTPKAIAEANSMLDKLYSRALVDVDKSQFMVFKSDQLRSAEDHQWGYAPFHYVDHYYASALEQLADQDDFFSDCFENKFKDTLKWDVPLFQFKDMKSAVLSKFKRDGIYQINLGNKQILDIYIQNASAFSKSNNALVSFSGAVANRSNKLGPFFSGLSISKGFSSPCIAISDPTLDINDELPLAWYAGNDKLRSLQQKIALLLDNIAKLHRVNLVLFGGSGAGFASLTVQSYLTVKSKAVVWNPQTAIEKYYPKFVSQYLKTAFPLSFPAFEATHKRTNSSKEILFRNFLDNMGIVHSLKDVAPDKDNTIIYLQNRDDWHLEQHANPFLERLGPWAELSDALFVNESRSVFVIIGDWGEGHAAPGREVVQSLLEFCSLKGFSVKEGLFDDGLKSLFMQLQPYEWSLVSDKSLKLNIEVSKNTKNQSIAATTYLINESQSNEYTYAFYLIVNGVRTRSRWYETNNSVIFDIHGIRGDIAIAAFVKDISGKLLVGKKDL